MSVKDAAAYLGTTGRTVQRLMTAWELTGGREGLAFRRTTDSARSWRRPYRAAVQAMYARRRPPVGPLAG